MMHGPEKSDPGIVAMKPANKAEQPAADATAGELYAAEPVERRRGPRGMWASNVVGGRDLSHVAYCVTNRGASVASHSASGQRNWVEIGYSDRPARTDGRGHCEMRRPQPFVTLPVARPINGEDSQA
jgi:hypothetical protein